MFPWKTVLSDLHSKSPQKSQKPDYSVLLQTHMHFQVTVSGDHECICKTVRPMLSVCCLSVTLVYCGQTIGWIKMKLGMETGLGPGHIVLDGDPAPPAFHWKGAQSPNFRPCLLWRNGWIDQVATLYGGRPRPGPHCVRWGFEPPPQFSAHVYCGQTVDHLSYCWALSQRPEIEIILSTNAWEAGNYQYGSLV